MAFSHSVSSSLRDTNFGLHSRKHLGMCNSLNFNVTIHECRVSTYLIAFLNMGQNREYPRGAWERNLAFIASIQIAAPLRSIYKWFGKVWDFLLAHL